MSMRCSISGNVPEDPVITSTGYVFERRLLEKFIGEEGRLCPVSREELPEERGVIGLQEKGSTSVEGAACSIPQLLSKLESEFDITVLENFRLRGLIDKLKAQLSHALYQHDAACRVIARLSREKEMLKNQLKEVELDGGKKVTKAGLPESVIKDINTLSNELCSARKAKTFTSFSSDILDGYTSEFSFNLHDISKPGILCLKAKKSEGVVNVFSGGADGSINIACLKTKKRIGSFNFHSNAVTTIDAHADAPLLISGSRDKTVKVSLGTDNEYSVLKTYKHHEATVVSTAIHPLGSIALSASKDGLLSILDLEKSVLLNMAMHEGIMKANFHPDGTFIVSGDKNGLISTIDVRSAGLQAAQSMEIGDKRVMHDVGFSENGYFLATTDDIGTLKIWDLRKTTCALTEESLFTKPSVVAFSQEATLLAMGGTDDEGKDSMRLLSITGKGKGREIKASKSYCEGGYDVTAMSFFEQAKGQRDLITAGSDNVLHVWKQRDKEI